MNKLFYGDNLDVMRKFILDIPLAKAMHLCCAVLLALYCSCGFEHSFYTREQAEQKIGHSVTCVQSTENHRVMKCPDGDGECFPVYVGDKGVVESVEPGEKDNYGIKILWLDNGIPTAFYS